MAKVTITLDDNKDGVAMTTTGIGIDRRTAAQRLGYALVELAEFNTKLAELPVHRRQPPSQLMH